MRQGRQALWSAARRAQDRLAGFADKMQRKKLDDGDALVPIVVAGSGRSGTTTMMQLLGTSSSVVFDRIYAYENAYLSYLIGLADLPLHGQRHGGPWKRAALDHEEYLTKHGLFGALPWPDRPTLTAAPGDFGEELLRAAWGVFSRRAQASSRTLGGPNSGVPIYYAETAPLWVADRVRRVLGGKTIYLVRDPRDQWLSIMAFNAQRGRLSFGVQESDTPESFARAFVARQKPFLQRVLSVTESSTETVVRFSELTTRREALAARLSTWLDLEFSASTATDHRADHATQRTPSEQARWLVEMPDSVLDVFREHLHDEIADMGWGWESDGSP